MADSIQVFSALDRITDASGNPIAGGTAYFYVVGTLTPKTVYADADLSVALGTSVTSDAGGYPVTGGGVKTLVYTGTADYKMIVKDAGGATIITHDDIRGATVSPVSSATALPDTPVSSKAANYTVVVGDQGKLINVNCTGGTATMTLPSAVTAGDSFRIGFRHVGTTNTVPIVAIGGQTISHSGVASTATTLTGYGECVWLVSDGANWNVDSYAPVFLSGGLAYFKVTDRLTVAPASPIGGQRYIVNGTATGTWATLGYAEHDVVEADGNGLWMRYTPTDGWLAYVIDENTLTQFRDTTWIDLANIASPTTSVLKSLQVEDQKAQGTAGGTPVATTWTASVLNTSVANSITGAALATNQVTLPAGTYYISANKTFWATGETQIRFKSTTTAKILTGPSIGLVANTVANAFGNVTAQVAGFLTLTAPEVFELQYWTSNAAATSGLGVALNNAGEVEVYAQVCILDLTSIQGARGAQGTQGPTKKAAVPGGPIPRTMWIEMDGLCQPGIVTLETSGSVVSFNSAYVTEKIHACYHDLGIRRFILASITDNGRTYTTWDSNPIDPSGVAFGHWWDDVAIGVQPTTEDFDVLSHIMDVTSALEGCEVIIGLGRHDDVDLLNDCYAVTFAAGPDPLTFGKTLATRLSEETTRYATESAAIYTNFGTYPSFGGFYITHESDHIQSSDDLYTTIANELADYGQVHVSAATPTDLADSNTIADALNAWHVDWVWPQTSTGYGYNWSTGLNAYVAGISIFGGAAHYATWRLVLDRARLRTTGAYTPKLGGHVENWRVGVQGAGTLTFGATSGNGVTVTLGTSDAITAASIGADINVQADQATGIARITGVTGAPVTSVTVNITTNLADVNIASGFWAIVPDLTDATVDAYPGLASEVVFEMKDQVAAGVEDVSLYAMQYWDPGNLSLRLKNSQAGRTDYRDLATTAWLTHLKNVSLMQQAANRIAVINGLPVYAVAALPSARPAGQRALVTDANATTFASIVAAGGANAVPVYSDATNWRIG